MNLHITVTEQADDRLSERQWRFLLLGVDFHLDSLSDWRRPTPRHKMKCVGAWHRLDHRLNTRERAEPSEEIKKEVLNKLMADITFK